MNQRFLLGLLLNIMFIMVHTFQLMYLKVPKNKLRYCTSYSCSTLWNKLHWRHQFNGNSYSNTKQNYIFSTLQSSMFPYSPIPYLSQRNFSSRDDDTDDSESSTTQTTVTEGTFLTSTEREERRKTLHEMLQSLDINANELSDAFYKSMTTMEGFDPKYGRSAIKTYKTFIDPKSSKIEQIRSQDLSIAASRCARQIDFLIKRHRSHETEWVRHTDVRNINNQSENDNDVEVKHKKRFPLIIVLDNVRSAMNVGSIFRTADACGCFQIFTTGITPSPNGRGKEKLAKSALGAEETVQSKHFMTTKEAIRHIREHMKAWAIIGMETTAQSRCYTEVQYPRAEMFVVNENEIPKEGIVLVLGNEVTGVDTEIMPLLDLIVEIPMFGTKNSLNIAACAPVVLYEILRQWNATATTDK